MSDCIIHAIPWLADSVGISCQVRSGWSFQHSINVKTTTALIFHILRRRIVRSQLRIARSIDEISCLFQTVGYRFYIRTHLIIKPTSAWTSLSCLWNNISIMFQIILFHRRRYLFHITFSYRITRLFLALFSEVIATVDKIPIMAITTSSSIRVKPFCLYIITIYNSRNIYEICFFILSPYFQNTTIFLWIQIRRQYPVVISESENHIVARLASDVCIYARNVSISR